MRSTNCQRAIDFVIYLEDKSGIGKVTVDNGGVTKWGISQRAFPNLNIAALTREDAVRLYEEHYWAPLRCDALPWPLAAFVFDAAVNQGQGAAALLLQTSLGVDADGEIGPKTLARVKEYVSPKAQAALAAEFMARRVVRYVDTVNFTENGRGWMTRLFELTMTVA